MLTRTEWILNTFKPSRQLMLFKEIIKYMSKSYRLQRLLNRLSCFAAFNWTFNQWSINIDLHNFLYLFQFGFFSFEYLANVTSSLCTLKFNPHPVLGFFLVCSLWSVLCVYGFFSTNEIHFNINAHNCCCFSIVFFFLRHFFL